MSPTTAITSAPARVYTKCRACGIILGLDDDRVNGLCLDHATRPDIKAALAKTDAKAVATAAQSPASATKPATAAAAATRPAAPRGFTVADKSLIKHTASFMPAADLLRILNERMHADVGADAPPYTLEQLQAEIGTQQQDAQATDWAGVRQVLQIARRCGVLAQITSQVIDDFCVCYRLSPQQQMHLRDVIRTAKEDR